MNIFNNLRLHIEILCKHLIKIYNYQLLNKNKAKVRSKENNHVETSFGLANPIKKHQ